MKTHTIAASLLAASFVSPAWARAQTEAVANSIVVEPAPPVPPAVVARDAEGRVTIRAVRLEAPIRVDGRLDEVVYRTVPAIGDFIQQEPYEGEPSTEKTEVWVLFDADTIYVAARCSDTQPDRMIANEMRRDSFNLFGNDHFGVILDTFYDRRNGFLFYTNPLGGLADGQVTDEREHNRDWNTVWDAKAGRVPEGWTVEFAIPFKSIRYRPGRPQIWGINFRRAIRAKNELTYLTRIPASYGPRGMQKLSSAATLVGIEPPAASRNFELKPYALGSLTTDRTATPAYSNDLGQDVGFDGKYGVTKSLTADFTVNTDFAQVEDDEQQVNLTRFSLFFPEKREFFLEGQGIFQFGGSGGQGGPGRMFFGGSPSNTPLVFFSRRIGLDKGRAVPIVAGGRLTGKAGAFNVGALAIRTGEQQVTGALPTTFGVVRVKRDILRRSSVGFIATHRDPEEDGLGSNQVLGLDANFAFHESINIETYYARTRTPGIARNDESYRAFVDYNSDKYGLQVEHLTVGEGFNPEVGFLRRENFRRNYGQARFSPRPRAWQGVRKVFFEASLDYITDGGGRLESRQLQFSSRMELDNGDQATLEYERNLESLVESFDIVDDVAIPAGAYRFQALNGRYQLGPQRRVTGFVNASVGGFYGGDRRELGYRGRVELSPRLSLEPGISFNWVDVPQGQFTTRLVSSRANYTVTARMLVAALIQYNSTNDLVSANLRFRWEYRPGSDLFVVYSEGRDTFGPGAPGLATRSFAVKLTRLVRF